MKKIQKVKYTWEAEGIIMKEAAVKYEVSLIVPQQKKPDLKIVGLKSADVMGQVAEIKEGLPAGIVDGLARELSVSRKELARMAGVAERTLLRRIQAGRLNADQSERMVRVSRLVSRAIEVLGEKDSAVRWLKAPRSQLQGKAPLDWADTELGCREVVNLLGRMEHGVFS